MLFGMLRRSGGQEERPRSLTERHLHGCIFCAANEVRKLSATALTACDADRLCSVMANLLELAKAHQTSEADLAEMTEWHGSLAVRVAAMRAAERREEREPDRSPVEVYIRTGLLPGAPAGDGMHVAGRQAVA